MPKDLNINKVGYSLSINSEDYLIITSPDAIIKCVNQVFRDFIEKHEGELLGMKFTDIFLDSDTEIDTDLIGMMTPVNPFFSVIHGYNISGKEKRIKWKGTGFFDKNGKLAEILFVGRDVERVLESKSEKDNLISTLTAFKQAIDMNIICTITDVKGVITYANEKFCQVSKYTQSELIGKTHSIVNSGHHPKQYFATIWKTIIEGHAWIGEIKNRAKDGTYYWVESVIIPIKDGKGIIMGYLSLRILIDEQKKLLEEKNAYLKTVEKMLFTVSHEIRKPIVTIQGLLLLIRNQMITREEEQHEIIPHLFSCATELDDYSRKLNSYLEQNIRDR